MLLLLSGLLPTMEVLASSLLFALLKLLLAAVQLLAAVLSQGQAASWAAAWAKSPGNACQACNTTGRHAVSTWVAVRVSGE